MGRGGSNPRPELVSPEVVVFATHAAVPDSVAMPMMSSPRDDVQQLLLK